MLHTDDHARRAAAWAVLTDGVGVAAVQRIGVAGTVCGVDRHVLGARLLQIEDAARVDALSGDHIDRDARHNILLYASDYAIVRHAGVRPYVRSRRYKAAGRRTPARCFVRIK